jgi:hypothetical protein
MPRGSGPRGTRPSRPPARPGTGPCQFGECAGTSALPASSGKRTANSSKRPAANICGRRAALDRRSVTGERSRADKPLPAVQRPDVDTDQLIGCGNYSGSIGISGPHAHYGVIKLLALSARRRTDRQAATDLCTNRLDSDHSPDHNRRRQTALFSGLARRIRPGQPRCAATCLLFASRGSGVQVPLAPPGKHLRPRSVSGG